MENIKTAKSLFRDAQEALNCNAETFGHLECIFKAIIDCTNKHTQANNLAKTGHYLTCDFGNLNDSLREQIETQGERKWEKSQ